MDFRYTNLLFGLWTPPPSRGVGHGRHYAAAWLRYNGPAHDIGALWCLGVNPKRLHFVVCCLRKTRVNLWYVLDGVCVWRWQSQATVSTTGWRSWHTASIVACFVHHSRWRARR